MLEEKLKHNTSAVLILTEDNFDNILEVSPIVLVEFFADWCSPCLAMEPIFHAAARRYEKYILSLQCEACIYLYISLDDSSYGLVPSPSPSPSQVLALTIALGLTIALVLVYIALAL